MIPKIIHYVWVGGNPKPKNIQRCMKTWRKHLKDYKIIEWNENNFSIPYDKILACYDETDEYEQQMVFVILKCGVSIDFECCGIEC